MTTAIIAIIVTIITTTTDIAVEELPWHAATRKVGMGGGRRRG